MINEIQRCSYKILLIDCEVDNDTCDGYDTDCPSYKTMKHLDGFHLVYDIGKSIEEVVNDLDKKKKLKWKNN